MWYHHYTGIGGFMMWAGFIVVLVLFYIILKNSNIMEGSNRNESPLEILKKRYAKGEITKEQFEQMKKELE